MFRSREDLEKMEEINQPSEQTKPMDTSSPDDIQVVVNSMRNAPGIPPTKYHLSVSSRGKILFLLVNFFYCFVRISNGKNDWN